MSVYIRQNFLLPKTTKDLLNRMVPKGQQSKFVAETIEQRLKAERSFTLLNAPARLEIKKPVGHARKARKQWDIS